MPMDNGCTQPSQAIGCCCRDSVVNHCLPDPGTIGALGDAYNGKRTKRGMYKNPVVLKHLIRAAALQYSLVLVDEFRTTKNCFNFGSVHDNAQRLQWISSRCSQKCDGCGKEIKRDDNAAH
jgi:hypothetical protein